MCHSNNGTVCLMNVDFSSILKVNCPQKQKENIRNILWWHQCSICISVPHEIHYNTSFLSNSKHPQQTPAKCLWLEKSTFQPWKQKQQQPPLYFGLRSINMLCHCDENAMWSARHYLTPPDPANFQQKNKWRKYVWRPTNENIFMGSINSSISYRIPLIPGPYLVLTSEPSF